jgi:hypothetical protein
MLADVFEKVYVVNLPRRSDRWQEFGQRLPADWPFRPPVRHEALDGGIVPPPHWWKDGGGAWGCYRTHVQILEECLNRDISSVLILEDDAACIPDFAAKVHEFWQFLPQDWEMVYLGGQHLEENVRVPRKVNDWVYQPYNINRTHSYGLRGRPMMERVYRHLHDFESWKVAHHIDHYLGELHKKTESGLYVPREWLMIQAANTSDVCNEKIDARFFMGAEELTHPKIDLPGTALMGNYFSGTNTLAGAMMHLGLQLGTNVHVSEDKEIMQFFEDHWLGEKCRSCFTEPWMIPQTNRVDRTNQLRNWAGIQCKYKKEGAKMFCGKHPTLSLMGEELLEAWNEPKMIWVDRPTREIINILQKTTWGWHPNAMIYTVERIHNVLNEFFKSRTHGLLKLTFDEIISKPQKTVDALCRFLEHTPTFEQQENAVKFIQCSKNDG